MTSDSAKAVLSCSKLFKEQLSEQLNLKPRRRSAPKLETFGQLVLHGCRGAPLLQTPDREFSAGAIFTPGCPSTGQPLGEPADAEIYRLLCCGQWMTGTLFGTQGTGH